MDEKFMKIALKSTHPDNGGNSEDFIRCNEIYKIFKGRIDWESFQKLCGEIIEKLYGNKSTRRYRNKNGETQKRIDMFRAELGEEPKY